MTSTTIMGRIEQMAMWQCPQGNWHNDGEACYCPPATSYGYYVPMPGPPPAPTKCMFGNIHIGPCDCWGPCPSGKWHPAGTACGCAPRRSSILDTLMGIAPSSVQWLPGSRVLAFGHPATVMGSLSDQVCWVVFDDPAYNEYTLPPSCAAYPSQQGGLVGVAHIKWLTEEVVDMDELEQVVADALLEASLE